MNKSIFRLVQQTNHGRSVFSAITLSTSLVGAKLIFEQNHEESEDRQICRYRQPPFMPCMMCQPTVTRCESSTPSILPDKVQAQNTTGKDADKESHLHQEDLFENLFPKRQLWSPAVDYPLWHDDWDGRKLDLAGTMNGDLDEKEMIKKRMRYIRKKGITRHIILVRHGQYCETSKEDEKRILTPLGRQQAEKTGERLAEMIKGINKDFGPCNITRLHVSNLTRAKETADIIAKHLPSSVSISEPNPDLNEGRPCHHIPGRYSDDVVKQVDTSHDRIEKAFQTYFYRANPPSEVASDSGDSNASSLSVKGIATMKKEEEPLNATSSDDDKKSNKEVAGNEEILEPHPQHEFEIIVCHANVIRYCLCRALQIPPEAWLRFMTFNCSLTYLIVRPHGSVSCRMVGDIGHLGYSHASFSMHHGFNW